MEPRPTQIAYAGERVYALLHPLAARDAAAGWPLLKLAAAIGVGEEPVWRFCENPGAAVYLDPDVAPADHLDWLATVVGGRLHPAMTTAQKRAEIKNPSGWTRGSTAAIVAAGRAHMTGQARVQVRERFAAASPDADSPWHFWIRLRGEDTPDPAAAERAVRAAIPAGLVQDVAVTDYRDWNDVVATWETWGDVAVDNTDWVDVTTA